MKNNKTSRKLSCVGKGVSRKDALPKVTGAALYVDDYGYDNMLYAAAVRNPRPHILIKGISDARMKKVPGFIALLTAADVPGKNLWPLVIEDYPFLPEKEAKFAGEAIALAVAETPEAAREAACLADVDFEELPFLDDPLRSMEEKNAGLFGEDNIFSRYVIRRGDAEKALRSSYAVAEGEFSTNYQVHAYLETQGMIARPEAGGGMTVYGSTQCPFYVHDAVVRALGTEYNKVRIVQRVTGGGFGGKEDVPALVAAHAALAARKTGRPVKMIYNRKEDFQAMSKRHPSHTWISYGADKNGILTACRVKYVLDAGAYSTLSPIVLWRGTVHAAGPYRIPDVLIESFAVATNKVPCGAYRGFGQPQICFANESLIDELALKLNMDPLEFRLKNALAEGDKTATGQVVKGTGLREALEKVKEGSGWSGKYPGKKDGGTLKKGIGVSANYYGVSLGARGRTLDRAGAQVYVHKDGTVLVAVGNTEMGQGAHTVLSQICAEALNAPYEAVRVSEVDTSIVPDSGPTVASRTTLMSGNAIVDACLPLRGRIDKIAADMLSRAGADLSAGITAAGGVFKAGKAGVSFREAACECWARREKMAEQGWYIAPPTSFNTEDGQGDAYAVYSFSADAVEVEVDTETGTVKVERVTAAHDLGKVVNPVTAEGQVQGGVTQGLGYALSENLVYKNGIMVNPNFSDYVLPSTADAPEFKVFLLEHPYAEGPYLAKGFGETPLIGAAPAVANAIRNATGVRISSLPIVPELLWQNLPKNCKISKQD